MPIVLAVLVLPFAVPGWSAGAAVVVWELAGSFGGTLLIAAAMARLQSDTPDHVAARTLGLANTTMQAAAAAGALAGGFGGFLVRLRATLLAAAALTVTTVGLAALARRRRPAR